jgi:hypothetical protein
MKYVCLGFFDEAKVAAMPKEQLQSFYEECFAYDDELRRGGHSLGGEAIESTAVTLRMKEGKVEVTDGPFVETKETLGGIGVLEARDLNHAVALLSKHPSMRVGNIWEIRPANEEMNRLVAERTAAIAKEAQKRA